MSATTSQSAVSAAERYEALTMDAADRTCGHARQTERFVRDGHRAEAIACCADAQAACVEAGHYSLLTERNAINTKGDQSAYYAKVLHARAQEAAGNALAVLAEL